MIPRPLIGEVTTSKESASGVVYSWNIRARALLKVPSQLSGCGFNHQTITSAEIWKTNPTDEQCDEIERQCLGDLWRQLSFLGFSQSVVAKAIQASKRDKSWKQAEERIQSDKRYR